MWCPQERTQVMQGRATVVRPTAPYREKGENLHAAGKSPFPLISNQLIPLDGVTRIPSNEAAR
jgi:hypothetical protein